MPLHHVMLGLVYVLTLQLPRSDPWSRADVATRRLNPREFVELPGALRAALEQRGCSVPQLHTGGPPHNIIRGAFDDDSGIDWAVLCSHERTSIILVFWNGDPKQVSEVARRPDVDFLQNVGADRIGFSRAISVATPERTRQQLQRSGGPGVPERTHAGIIDAFIEKASVVWYWRQGTWVQLAGAD